MKYSAILSGLLLALFPTFAFAATCDQSFEGTLRLGHSYRFNDTLTNSTQDTIKVSNFIPEFNEKYDYDGAASVIHYAWTPWIKDRKGIVQPGESGIIAETDANYPIVYSPPVRAKDNLTVRYVVEYSRVINGVPSTTVESHSECKSYEITWCGDGVVDSKYNEVCDLGPENGKPGSTCSATCTTVVVPPAACTRGNISLPLTGYITSGSPGLCQNGVPVNGFGSTLSGTTTNYFWACGASAIGGDCTASFTPTIPVCLRGAISLPPTTPLTVASFGLCPTGQTIGDFSATSVGEGINYAWSCSGSTIGGSCSATYNPANLACTPGQTTGPQPAALTAASPGLCPAGQSVGSFTATVVGNTTNYSWNCNGSQVGGLCVASYTPTTAPVCTPGPTTGPQPAPVTIATTGLCPAGQTVGDFTVNAVGSTDNYRWSCNGSQIGGLCVASYTPVVAPVCAIGTITLPLTAAITAATPNLCPAGQTVNGFTATTVGATTTYTWGCNGSQIGGACTASFTAAAPVCAPGPTTGAQTVALTAASVGLCPVGQTVGNFTATVAGATTNYTWSCNGSQVGGLCVASYTPVVAPVCAIGTITLPLTAAITAATPNLCPAGQTVNGFTATTVGATTTYTWGCNGSAIGGACTASFTTAGATACGRLTATATSSWGGSLTSTMTCVAGAAAGATPTFAISCGNGQTINAATGNCNYTTTGNFTASCVVNGSTPTPAACQLPISVTEGGGGLAACKSLDIQSNVQVDNGYRVSFICSANSGTVGPNPSYRIECGNGQASIGTSAGSCFYDKSGNYNISCFVENSTDSVNCQKPVIISSTGAPLPPTGGTGDGSLCGNGRIDAGETCDAGSNGGMPINNGFCNNCKVANTTPGSCTRGELDCPTGFTNPGGNGIDLLYNGAPVARMRSIVGNDVNPFNPGDVFSVRAQYPIAINGLTAGFVNNSPSGLITGQSLYRSIGDSCIGYGTMQLGENAPVINCGDYRLFTADSSGAFDGVKFLGNTSSIPAGQSSADANPVTSLGSAVRVNNFFVGLNYLIEPLPVRVARSAVSNTAGGNAYVGTQVGYSVNTITEVFLDSLKKGNFTVTSSSKDAAFSLSSNTAEQAGKSINRNDAQDSSISKFAASAQSTIDRVVTINSQSDFALSLSKVGDNSDLYTLPKGKIVINADIALSGVKTVVIDQGTLEIRGNITYADAGASWAFVVKQAPADGKAIIVASSVTDIAGVYIALNGKMVGTGQTAIPLAVDGNVNANIADLVNDRTYIRATNASTALSTGVTINYSTRAFKNPPPLLSQYLDQYNLAKIAQ